MVNPQQHIEKIIPYRMRAVATLTMALACKIEWGGHPKPMKIFFDDQLAIEGNSNLFINAALEAGLIHARALLDFMGLRIHPKNPNRLKQRKKVQHPDDIVIENYGTGGRALPRVTVREVVSRYASLSDDVEKSLATLISTTNKRLVHSTSIGLEDRDQLRMLKDGSEIVPAIVTDFFYRRLGLPAPHYKLRVPIPRALATS